MQVGGRGRLANLVLQDTVKYFFKFLLFAGHFQIYINLALSAQKNASPCP
jgi:hypothetical protein